MEQTFLEAENISKAFSGVRALHCVDLAIKRGEIHCLIGENGSGKSTLIKIVGGVYRPDSGSIKIENKSYNGLRAIEAIRAGVQIIYQTLALFPNLTVAENISMNQMLESNQKSVSWRKINEVAARALAEIGEDLDLSERVENLSMANRQIVAISRALTQNAKLIIMDEATSALTKEEVKHLFDVIMCLKAKGISILFVSHKLSEVFEISESVTILRDGQKVGDYSTSELDNDRLTYLMTGQRISYSPYHFELQTIEGPPLLKVRGLSKGKQFSDINFELRGGEILGVTGLIGSGRTEVALSLFGLNKPDGGEIEIDGNRVQIKTSKDAIKNGIAYLPEDRLSQGLFQIQPIKTNIVVTVLKTLLNRVGFITPKKMGSTADEWIEFLKIKTPSNEASASSLSGGNQQRVVIAKWLATKPKIFILDGPTVGIDIGSKYHIHSIIRDLARRGMGIILISDEIPEILNTCNRILIMSKGKIVSQIDDSSAATEEEISRIVSQGVAEAVRP